MTRTAYIQHVQRIDAFLDQGSALSSAIQQHLAKDDQKPSISFGADLLHGYMDLLEELSGDEASGPDTSFSTWLRWYVWEVRGKGQTCVVGGNSYHVSSAGDLWRVLQAWKRLRR